MHILHVADLVAPHQTQRSGCWRIAELLVCRMLQRHQIGGGHFILLGSSVTRIYLAQLCTPFCEDLETCTSACPRYFHVYPDCNTIGLIQMIFESGFFISPSVVLTSVHVVTLQTGDRGGSNDTTPDPVEMKGPRWYQCWTDGQSICSLRQLRTRDVQQEETRAQHGLYPSGSGPLT